MTQNNDNSNVEKNNTDSVLESVAETLKNSTNVVRERLTEMLVERKITSRVETLDKGLLKLNDLRTEFRKIKPDQASFDVNGVKAESYSKDAWEKRNKAKETLEKLEKAVESALTEGNFDKLQELVK